MKAFREPIQSMGRYEELKKALEKPGLYSVSGCIDPQKPHMIDAITTGRKHRLVVTFSEQKARELVEDIAFYDPEVMYYPPKDVLFYQSDIRGNVLTSERLRVMKAIEERDSLTVVTTFDALMNTIAPRQQFLNSLILLSPGESRDLQQLARELVRLGYEKNYQVEAMGQFAVRGGILDLYPLTEDNPVRIEFWGDEIDTIRSFDPETQKSIEPLDGLIIYPACELVLDEGSLAEGLDRMKADTEKLSNRYREEMKTAEAHRLTSRFDQLKEEWTELSMYGGMDAYLTYFCPEPDSLLSLFDREETLIFLDEIGHCVEGGQATEAEFSESMKQRLELGQILPGQMRELYPVRTVLAWLNNRHCLALNSLEQKTYGLTPTGQLDLHVKSLSSYNNSFELLVKDIKQYRKNHYRIILLSGSHTRAKRLTQDLMDNEVPAFYTEDPDHELAPGQVMIMYGKVKRGFEYPILNFVVITESDIFGAESVKKKKRKRIYEGQAISGFSDLSVGDYVVHENHGLGIYQGIEKIEVDHVVKDYIKIQYAGTSNLYILATQLDMIQKYAGKDAKKPKLNKLGSKEWEKTKSTVQRAVKQVAFDLVRLYALREEHKGYVYGPDTVWQREFEELFPYEETEDQLLAIEATKKDMESDKIMDRLICGDVGFGKTEIAIRAAFKAVQENKQVAYLAPTTILAQQVYNTFAERMKDFPVNIALLCRFRTPEEQRKTISDLKKGQVDIVIGTHRVLSKDVEYKDLGLLVIDEEQRFGVNHKEKIKQMKTNVDVLTLTATPIPRTLHMSLIGIRDMSVLEEPPMDRLPIQTYVMNYDPEIVREAILRELARDGQVYYVYNRVSDIARIAAEVKELVPDANVAVAHGQMGERELERVMYNFINGEVDVLISTTIIETGMDISNVNTMIIHDSDKMGLSQLYQLRGRIGRSNRTAYAFLMYHEDKILSTVASKRLEAIREFSDLGSGFKIAMRDLEIRGAGNLLGAEQSGHMEAVGYDLYCKMLNEAVLEEKGEGPAESFETTLDVETDAYIPSSYIANESQKLDLYKRIAGVETQEESEEMLEELIDRFGEPPKSVLNLLRIACLRAAAHRVYITELTQKGTEIRLVMYEKASIDIGKIPELISELSPALAFHPDPKAPYFSYRMGVNSREKGKTVLDLIENLTCQFEKMVL